MLCNNAGVGSGAEGFIWEHELADWNWGFDVNVWGVIHGIKAFVPDMVARGEPGHVVNTSSGNGGVVPFGDTAVYATTKSAVVTITESLYAHLLRAESIVRASVLFPGPNWLRTNLWDAWRWRPDEYAKTVPRQTPYPSLDQLEQIMAERGVELEWTPLEEVADDRRARHPRRAVLDAAAERHDRRVDPGARRVDARAREPDLLPRVEGTGEVNTERYTVISADGHAGASVPTYREYLASRWHDDFDAWAQTYSNPFEDLAGSNAYRNWDSDARVTELEADGIVAEVLFPNTIPPFFPSGALVTPAPNAAEYEHRWAGLQAHNRWLADFCAAAPGRRAGVAQILLNDVDDALGRSASSRTMPASSAACCCRACRRTTRSRRSGPTCTNRCGRGARSSASSSTTTAVAASRPSTSPIPRRAR